MAHLVEQGQDWHCKRCLDGMPQGTIARVYRVSLKGEVIKECPRHPPCEKADKIGEYCDVHEDGNLHPDCGDFEKMH